MLKLIQKLETEGPKKRKMKPRNNVYFVVFTYHASYLRRKAQENTHKAVEQESKKLL